jgi:hypothetical protein
MYNAIGQGTQEKHFFVQVLTIFILYRSRGNVDFLRLLFLHAHREESTLANEIPEESGHFRFLRAACLANIKGSVGLILAKASDMRIVQVSPRNTSTSTQSEPVVEKNDLFLRVDLMYYSHLSVFGISAEIFYFLPLKRLVNNPAPTESL